MKHVTMFSGGAGSEETAERVAEEYGPENTLLLFADTFAEDEDLYRFLIETAARIYKLPKPKKLVEQCNWIPKLETDEQSRKLYLMDLATRTMDYIPGLHWIYEGRTPWEVFKDERWIGNSRVAQCSEELKQKMSRIWVNEHYKPDECILYVGIDWTEIHRMKAITEHWKPYQVVAPLADELKTLFHKSDTLRNLAKEGIKKPRLYELGFTHNNCGGACVRGGQAHWLNLYLTMPERFKYHEEKEQDMLRFLERDDISILTKTRDNEKFTYTLKQLREDYENGCGGQIDLLDIGGCGCFAQYAESTEAIDATESARAV